MEKKVQLNELNEFIICGVCSGYLINASTVTECLHTCKSSNSTVLQPPRFINTFFLMVVECCKFLHGETSFKHGKT